MNNAWRDLSARRLIDLSGNQRATMKVSPITTSFLAISALSLPACHSTHAEEKSHHEEHHQIVATSPLAKDVLITQQYVCQIRSQKHIEIKAQVEGYLEQIHVKEGQAVKRGDVLFQVMPALYKARLDGEVAELQLSQIEFVNTKKLFEQKVVSIQELALFEAKLAKAKAKVVQAETEFNFATIRAPFDGIIDRLGQQQGSLVKKEEILTRLSDNSSMWVYFNVPESRYLEYNLSQGKIQSRDKPQQLRLADAHIELVLANGSKFDQTAGDTVTIEGEFNNETGNIAFRADFPNPNRLLRHGQTGTVLIHRTTKNALVIPQRATFEMLDKQYVFVIGENHLVQRREIVVGHEQDDIYIIKKGLDAHDKIVLEGVRQVHDGQKLEYEFRKPEEILANQKHHAE